MNGKFIAWCSILGILALYLIIQGFRCRSAVKEGQERLAAYPVHSAALSYGTMAYVDACMDEGGEEDGNDGKDGNGVNDGKDREVILSVHGIFGGYDQAFDMCRDFASDFRILAPSRFGYPGSDVSGTGTPSEQADAYVELLDRLGIDSVYLLAASAGGSIAFRFALDHPERTKGLILYSSAMPFAGKPEKYAEYAGPPAFLCNDYAMFLMSPLFGPVMGMSPATISGMLPVSERKAGVILDARITNPDMARNYDDYPVEELRMPILILHARDDKLASYDAVSKVLYRFPERTTFVSFETGGHLIAGHEETVKEKVYEFIRENG